ncbi:MAG TPA: hypothetical protein VNG53_03150, partial [Bacteroidia bacterium]|nr:hypothetical protein [Bacteroidia bacterium]
YYDDGNILFSAFKNHPLDYLQMLTGIHSDASRLQIYYHQMSNWYKNYNYHLYNDNRTIIRFNALVSLFSFGYYQVHTVFICFLSLTGLTALYKTFVVYLKDKKRELIFAVFLIPSVLFWGSGVLKEGLVLFAFGMLIFYFHEFISGKKSAKIFFWIVGSVFYLLLLKVYILLAAMPALLANWWIAKSKNKFPTLKYGAVLLMFLCAASSVQFFFPKHNPYKLLADKQHAFIASARGGTYLISKTTHDTLFVDPVNVNKIITQQKTIFLKAKTPYQNWTRGNICAPILYAKNDTDSYLLLETDEAANSRIYIQPLSPSLKSCVLNSPQAIVNCLFRPTLFESTSPLMLMTALENIFVFGIAILCLLFYKKPSLETRKMILFCFSFTLLLADIIGMVTPVLGAIVRYKVPLLPFLVIGFLLLLDKEKMLKKIPFLKKIL